MNAALDFISSIRTCFSKYVTFKGRASRSEFWFFILFAVLSDMAAEMIGDVSGGTTAYLPLVVELALLPPSVAASVRRLHDQGKPGLWYFVGLIPVLGTILLLLWFCKRGTTGTNQFGDDPLSAPAGPLRPA